MKAAIVCRGLSRRFADHTAVDQVDLEVATGTVLAVLGPSGCGKTTLLRLIAGFENPDAGSIRIGDVPVADASEQLPPERRQVGMVFQDYALFPHLSVADNITFGMPRSSAPQRHQRLNELLQLVGLPDRAARMPYQLSGGEQQRVALARALAADPQLLLLDEPLSNLDADLRVQLRQQLRQILQRTAITALFVTHDQEEAFYLGQQVAIMNRGRIEQLGTAHEVYHRPATRFVANFLGQANFLPARVQRGWVLSPGGRLPAADAMAEGRDFDLLVRPDDWQLRAAQPGNGTIRSQSFQGMHWLYHVALDAGVEVRVLASHLLHLPPGTRVDALLTADHPLLGFIGPTPQLATKA